MRCLSRIAISSGEYVLLAIQNNASSLSCFSCVLTCFQSQPGFLLNFRNEPAHFQTSANILRWTSQINFSVTIFTGEIFLAMVQAIARSIFCCSNSSSSARVVIVVMSKPSQRLPKLAKFERCAPASGKLIRIIPDQLLPVLRENTRLRNKSRVLSIIDHR